ncbi:MAG: malto-oligosyltrehalose trehalohydrolase [Acidobacteria bacterium]|nr:malto-oligosyltrehalose trehalohydrolase [Acidobacteriota bacterium]
MPLGDHRWRFQVWAPFADRVDLHVVQPRERFQPLAQTERGYYSAELPDLEPDACYFYRLPGEKELPDPASRRQPFGVHGPSQLCDGDFHWDDDAWQGIPLDHYVLYEIHTGVFTPEGSFEALIPRLSDLRDLGITAIELMPVAQFPGSRNWGYDGVYPFAVQDSYGGPTALKRLVNACHALGLAVVLDVVYNHLGPEGNYLAAYGPYFTNRYTTPWGLALNFDGPGSDEVRRFFIENALYWVTEFHIDALRLDAIHAIHDQSAYPFLQEIACTVHEIANQLGRRVHVIAESALNDTRVIRSTELGGLGLDAQWNDDFHHALRTLLTADRSGYYRDFGDLHQLAKAYREGFVYSGQYSSFRQRRHGNSAVSIPATRFVVFSQNHDQVGNRMFGERVSSLLQFESLKLAAAAVLLSPFLPLLFMGEEYGETAPFLYFVSHGDAELVCAVRDGRKQEFSEFAWQGDPPDPQAEETFVHSKLRPSLRSQPRNQALTAFYRRLIELRKTLRLPEASENGGRQVEVYEDEQVLCLNQRSAGLESLTFLSFHHQTVTLPGPALFSFARPARWCKVLDSSSMEWMGPGAHSSDLLHSGPALNSRPVVLNPKSALVYQYQAEE